MDSRALSDGSRRGKSWVASASSENEGFSQRVEGLELEARGRVKGAEVGRRGVRGKGGAASASSESEGRVQLRVDGSARVELQYAVSLPPFTCALALTRHLCVFLVPRKESTSSRSTLATSSPRIPLESSCISANSRNHADLNHSLLAKI
ncbi:hypothetical protein DFH09DRAFT_1165020 [Mycena vulgaris]|nr:hypothetical protein DFH09DRAFT_1165020 [Mycena vulgaris]